MTDPAWAYPRRSQLGPTTGKLPEYYLQTREAHDKQTTYMFEGKYWLHEG